MISMPGLPYMKPPAGRCPDPPELQGAKAAYSKLTHADKARMMRCRFWDAPQIIGMPPGIDTAMTAMKLADATLRSPDDDMESEVRGFVLPVPELSPHADDNAAIWCACSGRRLCRKPMP